MNGSSPHVVIIGGGLAGLSAAAALAEAQVRVLLVESRPRLGGRASSFFDVATQSWIDNCQHVVMGCCTNFRHFCRLTNLEDCFQTATELFVVSPDATVHRWVAQPWPAPLHLLGFWASFSFLSWRERWALARGIRALARSSPSDRNESMSAWLARHQQPPRAIRHFWQVILVSALSESLERISVSAARQVFLQGFLAHREAWQVHLPTVPLEELYGSRLIHWFHQRGVELRLLAAADSLDLDAERVRGVRLKSGEWITGEHYVLAVPWHRVQGFFPPPWQSHSVLTNLSRLESAPITSVHLWFDRPITSLPHAMFVDGLCQWLFQRKNVRQADGAEPAHRYYQVVISASRSVRERDAEEVLQQVLTELSAVWPACTSARLLHWRLVSEQRAVFSPLPFSEALRPAQQSPWHNLQFAGDWTQTGWPATMESAVRSGYLAAENILRQLGRDQRWLQPDLPESWCYRWLFAGRESDLPPNLS